MRAARAYLRLPVEDWAWILALFIWRLIVGSQLGLGVDEAHYALYGLRPALSYFDHPPFVGWTESLVLSLFGTSEAVVRLPAAICSVISTVLIYRLVLEMTRDRGRARAAALTLNASFLLAALWIMYLPDTPLMVLTLWLLDIAVRLLKQDGRDSVRDWVELGVCLGLAGLTKYTSVIFVISLIGIVASEKAWRLLKPARLLLAAAVALAIVSPVLMWNAQNDWVSFSYQKNHVAGEKPYQLQTLGLFLVGQFAGYSPFLIIPAIFGWLAERKRWPIEARVALWIALPTLLFFAYAALKDEVLLHWPLISWGLLLPLGIAFAWRSRYRKAALGGLAISLVVTVVLMLELTFQFIRFPEYQSPYNDLTGWPEIHRSIVEIKRQNPGQSFSIGVPNWTLGSRANYYLSDLAPVFVLDDRFDQFDIWEKNQPRTDNYLIVEWRGFELNNEWHKHCGTLEPIEKRTFLKHGRPVNSAQLSWCRLKALTR